ncbi:MAG: 50S ribosomal protein L25 [Candidatus Peregrinibacteria bacterium]|nr:50S ribosomal protein L25 [Candidatus Peregrinibacteria bacterium]MCB9808143.1 50S ribosomal protein L25 [Candidatus Peribacteria bacterium]
MLKTVPLQAKSRKEGDSAKVLRAEDTVPCVLYGNAQENTGITCDYSELFRAYAKAGASVIVDLDVDGKKVPVLFHEVQFAPVSDKIVHVDFYAVDMKKEIEAMVPIEYTGVSEAVKNGGVLVTVHDHLSVKCLPSNLPAHIEVAIDSLKEFGDAIHVSDVTIPSGVTVHEEPETMLATVQEPRQEKAPEVVAEGAEVAEGAGEKKEGEEKSE